MSLHVQLSPEAYAKLERQKKVSSLISFSLSILVITFTGFLLAFFLIPTLTEPSPPQPGPFYTDTTDPPPDSPRPPVVFERNPTPPSHDKSPVISADTLSPISVPSPDLDAVTPSLEFGENDDFGTDIGIGKDPGSGFIHLPTTIGKRCFYEDRIARLKDMGGTKECDDAVMKSLGWLQSNQSANGSWPGGNKPAAMTGLALLAYLGHCETPASQKYGDTVLRAILYLVDLGLKNDGRLADNPGNKHWPYEHAIATYALAEATTFCRQINYEIPQLAGITQKAGQLIIDSQHPESGGWDYNYDRTGTRGGDLSITAWHMQALKACDHTGLEFVGLKQSFRDGARYVAGLANERGGFGYTGPNSHNGEYDTLTGAGVLCLQLAGMENTKEVRNGIQYIRKNSKFDYESGFSDLYGHYYEAQAMMNRGGKDWDWYNKLFRDQLIHTQSPDGSWPAPGAKSGGKIRAVAPQFTSNEVYRACLNTLMLEVYYRFLPGTGSL